MIISEIKLNSSKQLTVYSHVYKYLYNSIISFVHGCQMLRIAYMCPPHNHMHQIQLHNYGSWLHSVFKSMFIFSDYVKENIKYVCLCLIIVKKLNHNFLSIFYIGNNIF